MELDRETLADLSIFDGNDARSVFGKLNFTITDGGRSRLYRAFENPLTSVPAIRDTQDTIRFLLKNKADWSQRINNGTIMVVEQFLKDDDNVPLNTGPFAGLNNLFYRFFLSEMYSALRYSLGHIHIFLKEMLAMSVSFEEDAPKLLKQQLTLAQDLMDRKEIRAFLLAFNQEKPHIGKVIQFGHFLKGRHHDVLHRVLQVYYRLDAWHSMAVAMEKLHLSFPVFLEEKGPVINAKQLFHLLLEKPVAYDVKMNMHTNFLFLTGANMAGKSTFIKSIGLAVFLAHLGMGVPAQEMELSFFEGMISNINVQDNIFLGESYFFNEVQRIKKTIQKINNEKRWLILIDEMFKGTNFQDAKQCSLMVIEGLLKMKNSLFVLSTHLYEIAESLKRHDNIAFRYFETAVEDETPIYNYQLREGISNDRLGFLILKREKVLQLLNHLEEE